MDEDIDFLAGPFPRSSPKTDDFAKGEFLKRDLPQADFSKDTGMHNNLDNPLPMPFGYDIQSLMTQPLQQLYPQPSQPSQPFQYPSQYPSHSSQLSQYPSHPSETTPLAYQKNINPAYMALNCIDVANHLTACPVCSRLHKSNSSTFMGVIIFLIIRK